MLGAAARHVMPVLNVTARSRLSGVLSHPTAPLDGVRLRFILVVAARNIGSSRSKLGRLLGDAYSDVPITTTVLDDVFNEVATW
jgi:hypothetical protein